MPRPAMPREDLDAAPNPPEGFPVVPEGVGVLFEFTPDKRSGQVGKIGTFPAKDGDHGYLVLNCECMEGEGAGISHGEFFDTSIESGQGQFRSFLERLGEYDRYDEQWDTEELRGILFRADVYHYQSKKSGDMKSALRYRTIILEEEEREEEEGQEEEEGKAPSKPKGRSRKPAKPRRATGRGGSAR